MVQERVREPAPAPTTPATTPAPEPAAASTPSQEIPVVEQRLDPREIARASLRVGRNRSLWWVAACVLVVTLVAVLIGTEAGAYALAALSAACAVLRAVGKPGPGALVVRAKPIDVTILATFAVAALVLGMLLPGIAA